MSEVSEDRSIHALVAARRRRSPRLAQLAEERGLAEPAEAGGDQGLPEAALGETDEGDASLAGGGEAEPAATQEADAAAMAATQTEADGGAPPERDAAAAVGLDMEELESLFGIEDLPYSTPRRVLAKTKPAAEAASEDAKKSASRSGASPAPAGAGKKVGTGEEKSSKRPAKDRPSLLDGYFKGL